MYPLYILDIENESDRAFMERLYTQHYRIMYAQAHLVCRNRAYLDDIVNEACVALIRKIHVIRHLECHALTSYIVSTVKSKAIDHLRRNSRYVFECEDALELESLPTDAPELDARLLKDELIDQLTKAIDMLSQRDQALLRMKYIDDMSTDEIAQVLNIQVPSVRSALMRARQRAYEKLRLVREDDE